MAQRILLGVCGAWLILAGLTTVQAQEGENVDSEGSTHTSMVFHNGVGKLVHAKIDKDLADMDDEAGDEDGDGKDKGKGEALENLLDNHRRQDPDDDVTIDRLGGQSDAKLRKRHALAPTRKKRSMVANTVRRWTKGIVPYVLDSTLSDSNIKEIQIAMAFYEKYSCIRFVPYTSSVTKATYGLDHNGYARFLPNTPCSSAIGNYRKTKGQTIRCCGRGPCVHELAHLLGMPHEHQSPLRDAFVQMNWNHIETPYLDEYTKLNPNDYISYGYYDATSVTHYFQVIFNVGNLHTFNPLIATGEGRNAYYQLYEISDSHGCKALKCSGFSTVCENEGYVSYVDDTSCTCLCPYGLDGATGCTTTITKAPAMASWPGGSYSLPSSVDGCPGNGIFSEGQRTHYSDGGNILSNPFNLKGDFTTEKADRHFCSIDNSGSTVAWPNGAYCINRYGGQCPDGFEEGSIQFDDSSSQTNTETGTLPDGVYGSDTLFHYCCRNDGLNFKEVEFPISDPFVLHRFGTTCPEVAGMYLSVEYNFFKNVAGSTLASASGMHPNLYIHNGDNYRTVSCYYRPVAMNCGGVIELSSANPSAVITSPNYPAIYPDLTECNWVVKAPAGSYIVLNFNEFDVEASGNNCVSYLDLRTVLLGQTGIHYCGTDIERSVRSLRNNLGITFRSGVNAVHKGFHLTASVVLSEDLCYDPADNGRTYRGPVNYAEDMQPCLSWTEVIQYNCTYNGRDPRYAMEGLDGNTCRNPGGVGLRPWCYTGYSEIGGCLRGYCDACSKEKVYNTLPDCDTLVQELDFCQKDARAISGCARTCLGDTTSLSKAADVSCSAPAIPSDGQLVSTSQASYAVGETVTVKCSSSSESHVYTCLSDATWDIGNYVCGLCPDGFTQRGDNCYKYFDEFLRQTDAETRCEEFGATIASARSQEEQDIIVSFRETARNIWLGATDKATEKTYRWIDNNAALSWTNWMAGQPKHTNGKDCSVIQSERANSEWKVNHCTRNYLTFVCKAPKSATAQCVDRRSNCFEIFQEDHQLCSSDSDFIAQECAQTCGMCNAADTPSTCVIPAPANEYTQLVSGTAGQTIAHGEHVQYSCVEGSLLIGGNLHRGCVGSDFLTGNEPICWPSPEPVNDVEVIDRSSIGKTNYIYTGPYKDFNITVAGEITSWELFSHNVGTVALQVWREDSSNSNMYKFIGQNIVSTSENIAQTVEIDASERIQVQVGDRIGVYYGEPNGGICYNYCSPEVFGETMRTPVAYPDITTLVKGDLYEFQPSTLYCRRFSLNAYVGMIMP